MEWNADIGAKVAEARRLMDEIELLRAVEDEAEAAALRTELRRLVDEISRDALLPRETPTAA